jgi:ATP-dependent DNA helicase PIF1
VRQLLPNIIEATVLTEKARGLHVFIPKIPLIPSDTPFHFKRLQFPVNLSFSITINKSQGQSLSVVGLHLEDQVFSHGQLYVGTSRVGNPKALFIHSPDNRVKNIVYNEVLRDSP